jgi:hypothetical protein
LRADGIHRYTTQVDPLKIGADETVPTSTIIAP